jgi:hypothetical protein
MAGIVHFVVLGISIMKFKYISKQVKTFMPLMLETQAIYRIV